MTVEEAQAAVAAAEQAVLDAKGKGVSAAIAASKALSAAKRNLTAAQKGVSTAGKTRTQVLEEQRAVDMAKEATTRATVDTPAYAGAPASETIKGFDITQRPEGKIEDGFIIYYSWIGGATTGSWQPYRAPVTAENMEKYGSRVFGGSTQADVGTSSQGANTLDKQPLLLKDPYGNIVGYQLGDKQLSYSGFTGGNNTGKTEVSRKTNPDGSITITYSDGTTSTIPASTGKKEVSRVKNADGSITITYSDGTTATIPASTGKTETGRKTNADGSVTITYSDGTTATIPASSGNNGNNFQYTGSDPATLALIKSLQDQIAALTKNLGAQDAATAQAKIDAAAAAEAAKKEKAENAITVLTDRFTRYGLASLVPKIKELAISGATESTITLQLQETEEYKQRFRANQDRIKKGLRVLDPGDYLGLEDDYRQILRAYGLKQFDTDAYVQQFIANDISETELSNRVVTAVQRVQNADPAVLATLRGYYGISDNDLVAYVLDPNQQFQKIERQVAAAEIGAAAGLQGLKAGVTVAEQLAAQGVTKAQAQKGYATIADILPTAEKLSDIYKGTLDEYRQSEAEQEVFNTLASAQRKRRALAEREIATFAGGSGLSKTALDQTARGSF